MNAPRNKILLGDAREELGKLSPAFIDCVVTSPPYYLLRDYGVDGQLGLEGSVQDWVDGLVKTLDEVARVIKPTGSLWLNLGDSFSRHKRYGAPPKGLLLAPERLLLALAERGWIVRNKVIWAKPNPMPTSVTDRLNLTYDVVYLLVRSPRYFFDLDAIREPHVSNKPRKAQGGPAKPPKWAGPLAGTQSGLRRARPDGVPGHWLGKNPGDVWRIATQGYRGAHFATFPERLIEKPILSTCPERVCASCGTPWKRSTLQLVVGSKGRTDAPGPLRRYGKRWQTLHQRGPLLAQCSCGSPWRPGLALDPFFGTGTVGVVASRLGRDWLGIELNGEFIEMAQKRLASSVSCGSKRRPHSGVVGRTSTEEVAVMDREEAAA